MNYARRTGSAWRFDAVDYPTHPGDLAGQLLGGRPRDHFIRRPGQVFDPIQHHDVQIRSAGARIGCQSG